MNPDQPTTLTTPDDGFDWDAILDKIKLRNKLTHAVMEENNSFTIDGRYRKEVEATINAYPHDLLRKIDGFITAPSAQRNPEFRTNALRFFISDGATAERINEAIYFLSLLEEEKAHLVRWFITALHLYPQLPPSNDYSTESPNITAQCTALLHVAYGLIHVYHLEDADIGSIDDLFTPEWAIANEKLVYLALEYPQQGEKIRDFIIQRKSVDTGFLEGMLAADAPVLNTGIL